MNRQDLTNDQECWASRLTAFLLVLLSQKVAAESGENQLLGKIHASARGPNMDGRQISDDSESRFAAFVDGIVSVMGHADRAGPLRDYCIGLMMPGERKSVEPMAAGP